MFLVSSLTLSTFSSSSLSPKFKVTTSNPEKDGGVLFLSLPVCAFSGCGDIASAHINIQERRMRAQEPPPAGSV